MKIKNKLKNKKAFNLLEIIVVIVIIGVLASISLPKLSLTVEKTRSAEGVQILGALLSAQKIYEFENGTYADTLAKLDVEIPPPSDFDALTDANVLNNSARLAWVERTGSYILCIDEDGTITCDQENGPANICSKLSFLTTGACS